MTRELISKKTGDDPNSSVPAKNCGLPARQIREKPTQATEMQGVLCWEVKALSLQRGQTAGLSTRRRRRERRRLPRSWRSRAAGSPIEAELAYRCRYMHAEPGSERSGRSDLTVRARLQRVGREMKMLVENTDDQTKADPGLLQIVARAPPLMLPFRRRSPAECLCLFGLSSGSIQSEPRGPIGRFRWRSLARVNQTHCRYSARLR